MRLSEPVSTTNSDGMHGVPSTYRDDRAFSRPATPDGSGSFYGPFLGALSFLSDVVLSDRTDKTIALRQAQRHPEQFHRRVLLTRTKAAAELLLVAGGELLLDGHLRFAILQEAHRLQSVLLLEGVKLCRQYHRNRCLWQEPLLGVSANA